MCCCDCLLVAALAEAEAEAKLAARPGPDDPGAGRPPGPVMGGLLRPVAAIAPRRLCGWWMLPRRRPVTGRAS